MKRSSRPSIPTSTELPRPITEHTLAQVRGGATAIEYGLLLGPAFRPAK